MVWKTEITPTFKRNFAVFFIVIYFGTFYLCGMFDSDIASLEKEIIPKKSLPIVAKKLDKPYSNPALIYSTSFGEFFQINWKLGNYKTCLNFTHSSTINEFGRERLLNYYKDEIQFAYKLKLMSIKQDNNIYWLNYQSSEFATRNMLRMPVIIENDSCKLIINSLNKGSNFLR